MSSFVLILQIEIIHIIFFTIPSHLYVFNVSFQWQDAQIYISCINFIFHVRHFHQIHDYFCFSLVFKYLFYKVFYVISIISFVLVLIDVDDSLFLLNPFLAIEKRILHFSEKLVKY